MQNNQPQNREELLQRAEELGFDVYESEQDEFEVYEDDGSLHVNHYGLRVCPYMEHGQGSSRRDFNKEANYWLQKLGYDYQYREEGVV